MIKNIKLLCIYVCCFTMSCITHCLPTIESSFLFSTDLYNQLKTDNTNIFFSPYSIHSALSIAYAGARGKTEQEMAQVLHISQDGYGYHRVAAKLMQYLNTEESLSIANKLFIQDGYHLLPSFLQTVKEHYEGSVAHVDFANNPERASAVINTWVEEQTRQRIKNIVNPRAVRGSTMAIANAIYFKGKWEKPFPTYNTQQELFHTQESRTQESQTQESQTLDDTHTTVDMMQQTNMFKHYQDEEVQVLELPYTDNKLSMIVVLPKTTLGEVEQNLTSDKIRTWLNVTLQKPQEVHVNLPKFTFESSYNLSNTLMRMGMYSAFGHADFSGIDGTYTLNISQVVHKACIEVEESGSEAAAATVILVTKSLAKQTDFTLPVMFHANHPFLFFIKENVSNTVLFIGRVTTP